MSTTEPSLDFDINCRLCGRPAERLGPVRGKVLQRDFLLYRCEQCRFAFIVNPCLDYDRIYTDAYYRGEGADPLVDYQGELDSDHTIRRYEWRGLLKWARSLKSIDATTRWVDYGCGTGGFVRYLTRVGKLQAFGYEHAATARTLQLDSAQVLTPSDWERVEGTFDVVTAIEVVEHLPKPVDELRRIRRLLRPGGILLCTTGNAAPYRDRLTTWRYVIPEVHISIFEPKALGLALTAAGFQPVFTGFAPGWTDIVTFKILKNMRKRHSGRIWDALPWSMLTRVADRLFALSAHPMGRAS